MFLKYEIIVILWWTDSSNIVWSNNCNQWKTSMYKMFFILRIRTEKKEDKIILEYILLMYIIFNKCFYSISSTHQN